MSDFGANFLIVLGIVALIGIVTFKVCNSKTDWQDGDPWDEGE